MAVALDLQTQAEPSGRVDTSPTRTFRRRRDRTSHTSLPSTVSSPREKASSPSVFPPPKRVRAHLSASKSKPVPRKQLMQTHLDLGQRNFYSTRCRTCGLVYTPGKDEDDRLHAAYHKNLHALRYTPAAADTAVTKDGSKGSIVRLAPAAGKSKTLKELVVLMDGQLGLPPGWLMAVQTTVFVYVCASTRGVLGAVFMERITQALTASTSAAESPGEVGAGAEEAVRRRDPTSSSIVVADKSSEVRAHCGVRMMWTSPNARRKGVATKLLDCARSQLAHGYVVPRAEVAFSQPTCDGAAFIQAYTGSSSFRVYGATL